MKELYASTEALSVEDEAELARPCQRRGRCSSGRVREGGAGAPSALNAAGSTARSCGGALDQPATAALDKVLSKAVKAVEVLDPEQPWRIAAVVAGKEGGTQRTEWTGCWT